MHVFAWLTLLIFCAIAGWQLKSPPPRPGMESGQIIGAIMLILFGLATITEVRGTAHRANPEGLRHVGPWSRSRFIAWSDVTSVRYSAMMQWFRVTGRDGTRIRVSQYLIGMPDFARLIKRHVPREAIANETTRSQLDGMLEQDRNSY